MLHGGGQNDPLLRDRDGGWPITGDVAARPAGMLRGEVCNGRHVRRCHHRAACGAVRLRRRSFYVEASYRSKQWRRENDQHQQNADEFEAAQHDL